MFFVESGRHMTAYLLLFCKIFLRREMAETWQSVCYCPLTLQTPLRQKTFSLCCRADFAAGMTEQVCQASDSSTECSPVCLSRRIHQFPPPTGKPSAEPPPLTLNWPSWERNCLRWTKCWSRIELTVPKASPQTEICRHLTFSRLSVFHSHTVRKRLKCVVSNYWGISSPAY